MWHTQAVTQHMLSAYSSTSARPHLDSIMDVTLPQLFDVLLYALTRGGVVEVIVELWLHLKVAQLIAQGNSVNCPCQQFRSSSTLFVSCY